MTAPRRRRVTALVVAVVSMLVLGACSGTPQLVAGSTVRVELPGPITSLNPGTSHGGTTGNLALAAAVHSGFVIVTPSGQLERDESFGRMSVVSEDPFTVRYELDERARWSDGTPVSSADLLLAWAADSGALNTPGLDRVKAIDPQTGRPAPGAPAGAVFFDGAVNAGLQHVTRTPQADPDDPRVLTMIWDQPFADWELVLNPMVPAHILAAAAFPERFGDGGTDDSTSAADAAASVSRAVLTNDAEALAPLAVAWNSAFDVDGAAVADPVTSGPYRIDSFDGLGGAVLVADESYRGDRYPRIERVELLAPADPLTSVQRLGAGEIDVVALDPTPQLIEALDDAAAQRDVRVERVRGGLFEHLDLRFAESRSGAVEDPRVRQAFLAALSRSELVAAVSEPIGFPSITRDSFLIAPDASGYSDTVNAASGAVQTESDPSTSRALLAAAGVAAPEVCVLYDPADPGRAAMFALIRDAAGRVGFVVTDCSSADWRESLGDGGAWDAALFGWRSTNPGVTGIAARLHSGGATNFSNLADPAVDALLDRLERELDSGARSAIVRELDARLWADSYGVPLLQEPVIVATAAELSGVTFSPYPTGLLSAVWQWSPAAAR